jgi:hypothetical protein
LFDPSLSGFDREQLLCLVCALAIEAKMNGLQFTDEAARQLEKAYLTRGLPNDLKQFGTSVCLRVSVF